MRYLTENPFIGLDHVHNGVYFCAITVNMFKLFGMLENFFYISLGITFALILLLVYHFKQRLSAEEKKSDTMYEILTNVVQELNSIKTQLRTPVIAPPTPTPIPSYTPVPDKSNQNGGTFNYVSDKTDDETDEDETSYSESESESESDASYESDDDDVSVIKYELIEVKNPEEQSHSEPGLEPISIEDISIVLEHPNEEVSIPVQPASATVEEVEVSIEQPASATIEEVEVSIEQPASATIEEVEVSIPVQPVATIEEVSIPIESSSLELKDISVSVEPGVDFKKLNMTQLKALAAAKYPDVDTGKMKKAEIIKLVSE